MSTHRVQIYEIHFPYFEVAPHSNIHLASATLVPNVLPSAGIVTFANPGSPLFTVALKEARCSPDRASIGQVTTLFKNLAAQWSDLEHDSISPILGRHIMPNGLPAFIIPFYANGNIRGYINRNPRANKSKLIKDIAEALVYLHSKEIVHGSINPNNIMITNDGRALLIDIGLRFQFRHPRDDGAIPDAWQYKPGEELMPAGSFRPTTQTDVYAFASMVYEVLSGNPPYLGGPRKWIEIQKIVEFGHRALPKPSQIDNKYWHIIQKCWARTPSARPTMAQVLYELEGLNG